MPWQSPEKLGNQAVAQPLGNLFPLNVLIHYRLSTGLAEMQSASAAVFLGGDYRVWDPGTSHTELWTRLRLATLHAIWGAARQRRKGVVSLSSAIAVKIVFGLRRSMWRDWQRTQEDIRLHTSMLSDWLRGRDPCISVEQFQALWGPSGGLYSLIPPVLPLGRPTLQVGIRAYLSNSSKRYGLSGGCIA